MVGEVEGYVRMRRRRVGAAGEGVGERRRRRRRRRVLSCVELFILISWREGHLVIGEVTHDFPPQSSRCGRTEFLRRLGHDKSRVRILYPKPDGILYYYFVPTSDVACVETGINTIRNRTKMCTHPTGGSPQYVPKPRLRYYLRGLGTLFRLCHVV
jgi:hypothetical protein